MCTEMRRERKSVSLNLQFSQGDTISLLHRRRHRLISAAATLAIDAVAADAGYEREGEIVLSMRLMRRWKRIKMQNSNSNMSEANYEEKGKKSCREDTNEVVECNES